jgi:hypothetical protein
MQRAGKFHKTNIGGAMNCFMIKKALDLDSQRFCRRVMLLPDY